MVAFSEQFYAEPLSGARAPLYSGGALLDGSIHAAVKLLWPRPGVPVLPQVVHEIELMKASVIGGPLVIVTLEHVRRRMISEIGASSYAGMIDLCSIPVEGMDSVCSLVANLAVMIYERRLPILCVIDC